MPFKSQAQRRKFYAMEDRGEISTKTLNKWRAETPKGKKLPERVKQAAFVDELKKIALVTKSQVRRGTEVTEDFDDFLNKLEPGDILVTKGSLGTKGAISHLIDAFQEVRGADKKVSQWTHAGLYLGDGKIRHSYFPLTEGKKSALNNKVRDQSLKGITRLGRDILALRPRKGSKERSKAVTLSKDMKNKKFNWLNLVRAGVLPKRRSKTETQLDNVPNAIICTNLVGYSYPKVKFHPTKSIETLMPSDIVSSKKVKSVAAFSSDPVFKTVPEYVEAMRKSLRKKGK